MSSTFRPCPYLGCAEDRLSMCSYPSGANVCYARPRRSRPYTGIRRDDQSAFCLADYAACVHYRARQAQPVVPPTATAGHDRPDGLGELVRRLRSVCGSPTPESAASA